MAVSGFLADAAVLLSTFVTVSLRELALASGPLWSPCVPYPLRPFSHRYFWPQLLLLLMTGMWNKVTILFAVSLHERNTMGSPQLSWTGLCHGLDGVGLEM